MKYYTVTFKCIASDSPKSIQVLAGDKAEAKNLAKRELSSNIEFQGWVILDIINTKTGK